MSLFKEKHCYLHKENDKGSWNIQCMRTLVPKKVCFKQTKLYKREAVYQGKH